MIIQEAERLNQVQEYYFSKKLQEIAQMQKAGKRIINLGIGSPDMPPSEKTIEALAHSAQNEKHHGYQSYKGIPEFRQAIAHFSQSVYGVELEAEKDILPLMGSKEGIMHISMAFLNPGDKVLIPDPGYPTYSSVSNLVGAEIIRYDMDESRNWEINIEKLRNTDLAGVKLMWVNYPHMPTGSNGSDELFRSLISLAKEKQFLLCNDNPYSLILNDSPKSILQYEGAKEVALELNSLSKSHNMAGWRLGWLAGAPEYINAVLKVKSNMDSGMFLPLQHAAVEALKNEGSWHKKQSEVYSQRKILAKEIFNLLECSYTETQVGMFLWAKVPPGKDAVELADNILYNAGVFITPGVIFGENGKNYLRISLCSDSNIYEEAIERIKTCLTP